MSTTEKTVPATALTWPDRAGFWWLKDRYGQALAESFLHYAEEESESPFAVVTHQGEETHHGPFMARDFDPSAQFLWLGEDFTKADVGAGRDVETKPETTAARAVAPCSADWQTVAIISDTESEEVNCQGGDRRRIVKSQCQCGQRVLVEQDANRGGVRRTCRADGKRIFYADESDLGWCVFRCKGCGEPISETCPAAAYAEQGSTPHQGEPRPVGALALPPGWPCLF